jgi:hypothetical protein
VSLCTTRVTCKLLRFPFSFRCLTCFFYSIHEGNSRICIGSLTTHDALTTVFRCFLFFSSISILVGCMECFGIFFWRIYASFFSFLFIPLLCLLILFHLAFFISLAESLGIALGFLRQSGYHMEKVSWHLHCHPLLVPWVLRSFGFCVFLWRL